MIEKDIELGDTILEGLEDYYKFKLCKISNRCLANFNNKVWPSEFSLDDEKILTYLNILREIDQYRGGI